MEKANAIVVAGVSHANVGVFRTIGRSPRPFKSKSTGQNSVPPDRRAPVRSISPGNGLPPGLPADDVGEVLSEFGGDDEGVKGVDDPVVFRTRWNCPVTKPNRTER
jgi:hypothetical protein